MITGKRIMIMNCERFMWTTHMDVYISMKNVLCTFICVISSKMLLVISNGGYYIRISLVEKSRTWVSSLYHDKAHLGGKILVIIHSSINLKSFQHEYKHIYDSLKKWQQQRVEAAQHKEMKPIIRESIPWSHKPSYKSHLALTKTHAKCQETPWYIEKKVLERGQRSRTLPSASLATVTSMQWLLLHWLKGLPLFLCLRWRQTPPSSRN